MAFSNSGWAWSVRGLTTGEHLVLLLLADQADGSGHISALRHSTIRARCGFSCNAKHSQKIIRRLIEKGFVKRLPARFGAYGNQVSNAFELDLTRHHPNDSGAAAGKFLWETAVDIVKSGQISERQRVKAEVHAEGATAYFDSDGTLLVWLSSKYGRQFFFGHLGVILPAVKASPRWPATRVELQVLALQDSTDS